MSYTSNYYKDISEAEKSIGRDNLIACNTLAAFAKILLDQYKVDIYSFKASPILKQFFYYQIESFFNKFSYGINRFFNSIANNLYNLARDGLKINDAISQIVNPPVSYGFAVQFVRTQDKETHQVIPAIWSDEHNAYCVLTSANNEWGFNTGPFIHLGAAQKFASGNYGTGVCMPARSKIFESVRTMFVELGKVEIAKEPPINADSRYKSSSRLIFEDICLLAYVTKDHKVVMTLDSNGKKLLPASPIRVNIPLQKAKVTIQVK